MYTRTRINIKNNTVFFFKFKYVLIIFKKRFTNTNVISRKVVNVRFPNPNNELLFIRHETVSLHYTKTLRIRPNDFSPFLAVLKKKKEYPRIMQNLIWFPTVLFEGTYIVSQTALRKNVGENYWEQQQRNSIHAWHL